MTDASLDEETSIHQGEAARQAKRPSFVKAKPLVIRQAMNERPSLVFRDSFYNI